MMENTNSSLRQRRPTRPACAQCRTLRIQCKYRNLEDDCEQCKSKGSSCRYFQSAGGGDEVEIMPEEIIQFAEKTPLAKRVALKLLSACTMYSALESATSDPDCEQVVENLKSEWSNACCWALALVTVTVALFTIDSQSLFKIDLFSQRAIAASSIASFLGFLYDLWFLSRYYPLEPRVFMTQARDIYGSHAFFALSARLPSLAVLISVLALGVFVGRVAYQTLPAFVIVLGSIFFAVMVLQFILRGSEALYRSIAEALCAVAERTKDLRNWARSLVERKSDLPTHTTPESNGT